MEGIGIWIFLLLFYLLQAITKNQQKKRRQQQQGSQPKTQSSSPQKQRTVHRVPRQTQSSVERGQSGQIPKKPQKPVSLEDLFNPDKLRDILGVPQPKPAETPKPVPKPVAQKKSDPQMRKRWAEPKQSKPSLHHEEIRETGSKVASADITDVDESSADFKSGRLGKSDITSDRFDKRKAAPGKKKPKAALEYFDEPEDIRNAIILKEILDRPRAFRRNIR